jgi:hypothetical protein
MFMTITTTYFRENLADVINRIADDGEEIILVLVKVKNLKKLACHLLLDLRKNRICQI